MITNRVLGNVLLGINEQVNCNDCISAFGSAGSFSAGIHGRKNLTSSGVGGTKYTAELLTFAAEHGITADIELLPSARVEDALTRLGRGDVRYRFVLDMSDLDMSDVD